MKKALMIVAMALLVRGMFFCVWVADGRAEHLSSDSGDYYALAQSLNHGEGFNIDGQWVSRRPPLYSVFLAGIIRVLPFPAGAQIFQILLGAMCCVLAYGMGRHLFGEGPGFFAGLLLAFNYEFIRQVMTIMPEILYVFFILISLWLTFMAKERLSFGLAVTAGAGAGLSLLTKDVLIFFYPVVALWLLGGRARFRIRAVLMLCYFLGLAGIVLPWQRVNASHKATTMAVVTDRLGMTFYIANNPKATGGTGGQEWALERDSFLPPASDLEGLSAEEVDQFCFKQALAFIQHQPKAFLHLMGLKIINMWRPYTSDAPQGAQMAMALTYIPLLILGAAGMILSLKRWKSLLPLYILIGYIFSIHAVLIAHIRYRFAALPVLALFAGYALFFIWEKARGYSWTAQKSNSLKVG